MDEEADSAIVAIDDLKGLRYYILNRQEYSFALLKTLFLLAASVGEQEVINQEDTYDSSRQR